MGDARAAVLVLTRVAHDGLQELCDEVLARLVAQAHLVVVPLARRRAVEMHGNEEPDAHAKFLDGLVRRAVVLLRVVSACPDAPVEVVEVPGSLQEAVLEQSQLRGVFAEL